MRRIIFAVLLAGAAAAQPPTGSRPFKIEELRTLPGFEVSLYAHAGGARLMAFGPNDVLYVAARDSGAVVAIPSANSTVIALRGLNGPHGLVFVGNDLYIASNDAVLRYRDAVTADYVIRGTPERLASLPTGGGHATRTLAIGPDGRIYVAAGSTCNFCVETDSRRAAVTRYEPDGSGQTLFARGLRNSVGLAWHPLTGELWGTDNGGDGLGDDTPPEEINVIREGVDYGWPDCYGQRRPVSWGNEANPARCPNSVPPEQEMQAHSAPLGISFYTGDQFPASYRNDAFVAFHGSWNRNDPTGYKVVRIHTATGRAAGVEDFLTGFFDTKTRTTSGRPVHAVAGPDGALYISDDHTGNIYRVRYVGPRIAPQGLVSRGGRIFELYGTNLTNATVVANAIPAQVLYTSARQINFVLPEGIAGEVTIVVTNEVASDSAVVAF